MVEVAGAFVLAAEAIGLETLEQWIAKLTRTHAEMAGEQTRRGSTFLDPNRFIAGFGAAAGVLFACWVSLHLPEWPSNLEKITAAVVGVIVGAVFGVLIYRGALVTLQVVVRALLRIESRVRLHAVGVLGFGLLAFGFCLQFIGTLVDGLNRSSK
jgi:hypothetical protein